MLACEINDSTLTECPHTLHKLEQCILVPHIKIIQLVRRHTVIFRKKQLHVSSLNNTPTFTLLDVESRDTTAWLSINSTRPVQVRECLGEYWSKNVSITLLKPDHFELLAACQHRIICTNFIGYSIDGYSLALPTLFTPLAFWLLLAALAVKNFTASAANNNQKASGLKRVGNARLRWLQLT